MTRRQAALHGFGWGCIGGLALVALMYLANLILGLRPLPQLLNEPLLSLMPGFVFGFLIVTIACHVGMTTQGGTAGVGKSTTVSVVAGSVAVIAADFFVTQIFIWLFY